MEGEAALARGLLELGGENEVVGEVRVGVAQGAVDAEDGLAARALGRGVDLDLGVQHLDELGGLAVAPPVGEAQRGLDALLVGGVGVALQEALERRDAARALGPAQGLLLHVPGHARGLGGAGVAADEGHPVPLVGGADDALEGRLAQGPAGLGEVGAAGVVVDVAGDPDLLALLLHLVEEEALQALGGGGGPLAALGVVLGDEGAVGGDAVLRLHPLVLGPLEAGLGVRGAAALGEAPEELPEDGRVARGEGVVVGQPLGPVLGLAGVGAGGVALEVAGVGAGGVLAGGVLVVGGVPRGGGRGGGAPQGGEPAAPGGAQGEEPREEGGAGPGDETVVLHAAWALLGEGAFKREARGRSGTPGEWGAGGS